MADISEMNPSDCVSAYIKFVKVSCKNANSVRCDRIIETEEYLTEGQVQHLVVG